MIYTSLEYPIMVELLFDEHTKIYAIEGTIQSALETYNSVITFTI